MPTGSNPSPTGLYDCGVVHLQGCYGGPTAGCQANDLHIALTPGEVIKPNLLQGVKERSAVACSRIYARALGSFMNIAREAGQA
jgi:hypothetical protein